MIIRLKLIIILLITGTQICNARIWESINSPTDSIKFASFVDISSNKLYYSSTIMNETQSPTTNIYCYDGDSSIMLFGQIQGFVYAISIFNGKIIIGGMFNEIDGQNIKDIAIYESDHFMSVSNFEIGEYDMIKCFATFNSKLYIGGSFHDEVSVVTWDGENVAFLGDSPKGVINAMFISNDTLFVGGTFSSVAGFKCENIALTDGYSWYPKPNGLHGSVLCFGNLNNMLYIGGYFLNSDDTTNVICSFTYYDNEQWNGLSLGIVGCVSSIVNYNNALYAAGLFDISGGYNERHNITIWDGSNWANCDEGISDSSGLALISSMAVFNNKLYLFGKFSNGNSILCKNVISLH